MFAEAQQVGEVDLQAGKGHVSQWYLSHNKESSLFSANICYKFIKKYIKAKDVPIITAALC
jgi:hypothetical protein